MKIDRRELPSVEALRELFNYDSQTGVLTWRIARSNRIVVGSIAGTVDKKGYLRVKINGTNYLVHRVIWKIFTGCEPPTFIDHSDLNKSNNVWGNLREATAAQNAYNSKLREGSASGVKGVKRHRGTGKWMATIRIDGAIRYLGIFSSVDEAASIVNAARQKFHGEFARAA